MQKATGGQQTTVVVGKVAPHCKGWPTFADNKIVTQREIVWR